MEEKVIFKFTMKDSEHYASEANGTPDDLLNAISVLSTVLKEELVDTHALPKQELKALIHSIVDDSFEG